MQGRDVAFWPSLHNPHIIRTVCLYWDGWQAWDSKKKKMLSQHCKSTIILKYKK